jgi:Na+/proline symporter
MNARDNDNLNQALSEREESVFEMVAHSFQGRARWIAVIGWIKMFCGVLLSALAIVEFFRAETVRGQIAWASAGVVCALGTAIIFVLYWLELNRNAITRELKRLELQIAQLRGGQ